MLRRVRTLRASAADGATALFMAVQCGQGQCVLALLHHGADPNLACLSDGNFPLLAAISSLASDFAGQQRVMREMIKRGANVNARRFDGASPLLIAAQTGDTHTATLLLNTGGDPNRLPAPWRPTPPKPAWIATGDCPGGHGLVVFEVPAGSRGYGCDGCGCGVPAGAAMKGCRVCDVDLCGACCSEGGSGNGDEDERGGEGGGDGNVSTAVKVTSARRKYEEDEEEEEEGEEGEEGEEMEKGVVIDRGRGEVHPYPSPLFLAAQFGHAEVCMTLIRSGTVKTTY